jgi:RNA polymerase sigma-70 factor (ECF subfamily)
LKHGGFVSSIKGMIAQVGDRLRSQQINFLSATTEMDDATTMTPAGRDDLKLFEAMLDGYKDKVFRLACGMLGNETAAQDIAQEVFLKIWKALPQYRGDASPSSWIYTITRNTCLNELKRSSFRKNVSLAQEEVQAEAELVSAGDIVGGGAGAGMDIQAMLAQLPDNYRQVIRLFYLEQKSYEEVAVMLDIPIGTVKTNLHRAKKELSKMNARRKETYA